MIETTSFWTRQGRRIAVLAMFATVLIIAAQYATSHSGGMTGQTNKVGDGQGCTCHCNSSNSNTSVSFSTQATTFEAGQTYTFTITVSNGNEVKGGCDIAVQNGSLAAGNDGLQLSGSQLTHTAPKTLPATWTFTYTAPSSAGPDTLFAAGNAVNNDGGNGAGNCTDQWNFATKYVINVTAPLRTLVLSRNSIAFGTRRVGGSYNDTVRLSATGNTTVGISQQQMKTAAMFSNSNTSQTNLTAGSNEVQTITFSPTSRGQFADSLVVISDANNSNLSTPGHQGVAVSGQGIQAIFSGANLVNFGNLRVGQTKTLSYSITNTGDDTLFLTTPTIGGSNAGSFSITSQPTLTLLPNASTTVGIQFAPATKQQLSATLQISAANGVQVPSISLAGTGTAPIVTILQVTDLGVGKVGGSRNGSIQISNGGDADLNISSITIGNQAQGAKFQFTGSTAATIAPLSNATFPMQYFPTAIVTDTAVITIASDDITSPSFKALVVGEGGLPKMTPLQTDTIKFGDVRVGSSAQNFSLQVKNDGTYDLTITSIEVSPSQFTVTGKPSTVAPRAAGQVSLKFTPTGAGKVNGTIIVHGDDANNPVDTVYVSGNGTVSNFDVTSGVSFGDLKVGTSKDTTIKMRNLGTATVNIISYGLTDPSNGGFQLFPDTASIRKINPHDSATIQLRFNAFKEQSYSGTITITTDEGGSSTRQIQLSGRGVNSKLQISATTLDFGTIDTGTTSVKTFTITNTGTAPAKVNSLSVAGSTTFAVDSPTTSFTIAPNGSTLVSIHFNPVAVGDVDATLTIGAAEGTQPQVLLHGVGKGKDTTQSGSVAMTSPLLSFVRVTPNPASTSAMLTLGVTTHLEDVRISFYDAAARLVLSQSVGSLSEGVQQIPLTLPTLSGVSFVRITSGGMLVGTVEIVITR